MSKIKLRQISEVPFKSQAAFTIVELVVIIVVLAILVSVAGIGISSWRTRVATTEVKNSLISVQAGMEDARNFTNGYPVFAPGTVFDGTNATESIFVQGENVTITYDSGNATSYCIEGVSSVPPNTSYFMSTANNKDIRTGTC